MQQQPPDTGQQPYSPPPRRRTSSIPRPLPKIATNVGNSSLNPQSSSTSFNNDPPSGALNFYQTRKPVIVSNGTSPISTTSPTHSFDKPSLRSASEALSRSATTTPVVARPPLSEKASFRDLVARFNNSSPDPSTPPSLPKPGRRRPSANAQSLGDGAVQMPTDTSELADMPPGAQNHTRSQARQQPAIGMSKSFDSETFPGRSAENFKAPRSSMADHHLREGSSQSTRLFGEVSTSQEDLNNGGHTIPPPKGRRDSDGSMRVPNPMFSQSHIHTGQEHAASASTEIRSSVQTGYSQTSANTHGRSRSVIAGPSLQIPRSRSGLRKYPSPAQQDGPDSTYPPANFSPQSRIAIPDHSIPRHSDVPSARSNGVSNDAPMTPISTTQPGVTQDSRSILPSTSNPTLRAIINAPMPRKSPPLRSSRPRQDVNSARSVSPNFERGVGRVDEAGSPRRRNASMDVVTRQDSIRRAMRANSSHRQSPEISSLNSAQYGEKRRPSSDLSRPALVIDPPHEQSLSGSQERLSQLPTTTYQRPGLKLDIHNISIPEGHEVPNTGLTEFEDESPILEVPGSFRDSYDLHETPSRAEHPGGGQNGVLGPLQNRSRTVVSQIMEMRNGKTATTPHTDYESPSVEKDDAGTIQIMLGETPVEETARSDWYRRDTYNENHGPYATVYGRDMPAPPHSASNLSPTPWTPAKSDGDAASQLTRDSDSYSAINRILDQYHQSGIVSPEMVHEFQYYMMDVDPELASRNDPETMIVAKTALEDILRDHARAGAFGSDTTSVASFADEHEPSPRHASDQQKDPPRTAWRTGDGAHEGALIGSRVSDEESPLDSSSDLQYHNTDIRSRTDFGEEAKPRPPPKNSKHSQDHLNDSVLPDSAEALRRATSLETPLDDGSIGFTVVPTTSDGSTMTPTSTNLTSATPQPKSMPDISISTSPTQRQDLAVPAITPATDGSPANSFPTPIRNRQQEGLKSAGAAVIRDSAIGSRKPSIETGETNDVASPSVSLDQELRRLTKRRHLIKELIDTEASYNQDMKVIEDIYLGTASACDSVTADDRRVLFGNSTQIVRFSESFLAALKKAGASVYVMPPSNKWRQNRDSFSTSNSSSQPDDAVANLAEPNDEEHDRKSFIGEAFNQNMTQMEDLYTVYLRNHDYANQRLKKLQEISKVKLWLNECHTYAADITSAWDLDSLLVKPVQRILKYPLLLKSLLESTPEDHPDHEALKRAVKEMMDASYRINESKKRAEVLDQVMRNTKRKDFDISKLVGRRTDKLRQQVGLSEMVDDADYKRLAQRYETRYVHLQIVMRDFEVYKKSTEDFMGQFEQLMRVVEEMAHVTRTDSPELESKWRKFAVKIREMRSIAHADHDAAFSKHCLEPLLSLIKLHEAPQKLMLKRKKRLVEYAKFSTMKNRGEKIDKKTQEQGEQFIALNETLKDELPKLFNLSARLIEVCLRNFVDLQARWQSVWKDKVKDLLDHEVGDDPETFEEIIETFNSDFSYVEAHVLSLGICNGSLLADVSNFLSSSGASFATEDTASTKRPSLHKTSTATTGDLSPVETDRRSGSNFNATNYDSSRSSSESQLRTYQQNPTAQSSYSQERYRASSNVSSQSNRNPSSRSVTSNPIPYVPHQESRSSRAHQDGGLQAPPVGSTHHSSRMGVSPGGQGQVTNSGRPLSSSTYNSSTYGGYSGISPTVGHQRQYSSAFSSAMPMSESPTLWRSSSPAASSGQSEYQILFLAASLYDFNIEQERSEAGYPYLFYTPGEVFDVIGQKGELWLARNQDDPRRKIGWIWEKHFAKLMSED